MAFDNIDDSPILATGGDVDMSQDYDVAMLSPAQLQLLIVDDVLKENLGNGKANCDIIEQDYDTLVECWLPDDSFQSNIENFLVEDLPNEITKEQIAAFALECETRYENMLRQTAEQDERVKPDDDSVVLEQSEKLAPNKRTGARTVKKAKHEKITRVDREERREAKTQARRRRAEEHMRRRQMAKEEERAAWANAIFAWLDEFDFEETGAKLTSTNEDAMYEDSGLHSPSSEKETDVQKVEDPSRPERWTKVVPKYKKGNGEIDLSNGRYIYDRSRRNVAGKARQLAYREEMRKVYINRRVGVEMPEESGYENSTEHDSSSSDIDAVWANETFAQLGENGLDDRLTPEERLRVLKKLRTLLRLHQEERLKRWSKAWAWGSDQEVAAAINEMIKKNAIVHEDAKEDTEAQPTLHDLMRDFLTQADAVRQALAVETRGLEQRVEKLLRAQRHGGGHDISAVEMDNEDAGPPALDISSSDEEQGRKDEGRVKRHSRAERRRRVRENARESISDRTHHLCGRKPQNGKAGCVCRTCHFDRRENATKEREPPVLPLSPHDPAHNSATHRRRITSRVANTAGGGSELRGGKDEACEADDECASDDEGNRDEGAGIRRFAPDPGSSYMRLAAEVCRLLRFDGERQEYVTLPCFEAAKFLQCYKVSAKGVPQGVNLMLLDSGSTCFLSPCAHHFPVELKCSTTINGIGNQKVTVMAPQIISVLNAKATKYITFGFARGYRLNTLGFGIISSGQMEKQGYLLRLQENSPYFMAPDGDMGNLIKDYHTGLTWIAERPRAKPSVEGRRAIVKNFQGHVDLVAASAESIGEAESMPTTPDSKDEIDRMLGYGAHDGDTMAAAYNIGGRPQTSTAAESVCSTQADPASTPDAEDAEGSNMPTAQHLDQRTSDNAKVKKMLDDAEQKAAARVKPVFVKLPTKRMMDTGDTRQCQDFLRFWHALSGHLGWSTIWEAIPYIEGGDLLRALQMLRKVNGTAECEPHCDACARMKAILKPPPRGRTTRPTCKEVPDKIYLDSSGLIDTKSIYHNFQYYLLATCSKGFLIVQFMSYKSQSLFKAEKTFAEVGGKPKAVGVDGCGEFNSRNAIRFFTSKDIAVDTTLRGESWRNGRPERGHDTVKKGSRAMLAHACAPKAFWAYAVEHMVLIANLFLRARDPVTREKLPMTLWESHYGEKPDINKYLPGPWGCLGYITLTKEVRSARGFDKTFGPRAVGGIFLGCHVNPRTAIYHFLIHDGQSVISTTSDLRIVGDCFPFRWQRGRDVQLRLTPPEDVEDDEDGDPVEGVESKGNHNEQEQEEIGAKKGAITWVRIGKYPIWPCLLWPEQSLPLRNKKQVLSAKKAGTTLVYTLGDHRFFWAKQGDIIPWKGKDHRKYLEAKPEDADKRKFWDSFREALQQAQEEEAVPGTHWPVCIEQLAMHAFAAQDRDLGRQLQFVGEHSTTAMAALESRAKMAAKCGIWGSKYQICKAAGIAARDKKKADVERKDHDVSPDDLQDIDIEKDYGDYLKGASSGDEDVDVEECDMDNPIDFVIEKTGDIYEIEPIQGADMYTMHPVDHTDEGKVPKKCSHLGFKLVGRRVRKLVRNQRSKRGTARPTHREIKGVVASFDEKRVVWRVRYDGGVEERLDLVNLKNILILDKNHGDPHHQHGRTNAEIQADEIDHVVCAAVWEEYVSNRIPDDYGERGDDGNADVRRAETTLTATPKHAKPALRKRRATSENAPRSVRFDESGRQKEWHQEHHQDSFEFFPEPEIKDRKIRDEEKRRGAYKEQAFFVPTPVVKESDHDVEEVPRDDEPKSKKEALRHRCPACRKQKEMRPEPCERCLEERKGIFESWEVEMDQLRDKKVYRELSEEEQQKIEKMGHKILNAKMVTKRKYEAVLGKDGVVRDRFLKWKGRLACVGTSEVKGVDMPWSTFSPVIGLVAVRTVMSLMCREDFHVNAYDLSGAFLAAELDRPVYMKLPAECGKDAGKVVQLTKAIYGLKTSSRDYVDAFSKKVLEFQHDGCKFQRLYMDACIFRFVGKNGEEIILCHYVDDLIIGCNSIEVREKLLTHIREKWAVTDEGPMTRFIGLNFERSALGRRWSLSCAPYIERVGARFKAEDGRFQDGRCDTPMDSGFVITPEDLKEEPTPEMLTEFRSLIGSIGFAATTVRYDVAYAVSVLSRYLMRPNQKVIEAAKRVIRYLLKTRDFKITWSTEEGDIAANRIDRMWGAVDASFAADPITRRSHSGFIIFNNGGPISWKSGLQKMVTLSSCESEFVGLCGAVVEIRYLRQLMEGPKTMADVVVTRLG